MPNFSEIIVSIVVGWAMGMASTWAILSKPWFDRHLLAKKPVTQASPTTPALTPVNTGPVKIV